MEICETLKKIQMAQKLTPENLEINQKKDFVYISSR